SDDPPHQPDRNFYGDCWSVSKKCYHPGQFRARPVNSLQLGGSAVRALKISAAVFAGVLLAAPSMAQQHVPEIAFDSVADFPKLPDGMNFGEVPGVAVNSKGHVYVFTRSNSAGGPAYAPTAAPLLEF